MCLQVELDYAQVVDLRDVLASRERDFIDWSEGLPAPGLDADLLPRLEALSPGATLEL